MNVLIDVVQIFIGFAGGLAVGSGMVAFLVVLDIIPRLVQLTKSIGMIHWYENAVVFGSVFFSLADFYSFQASFSPISTAFVGLMSGVFVGLLAAALTEVINVLPVLANRMGMGSYIIWLLMAMIFGKVFGSLFEWLFY